MTTFIKNTNVKLYENLSAGSIAVPCKPTDGRTDGRTDLRTTMMRRVVRLASALRMRLLLLLRIATRKWRIYWPATWFLKKVVKQSRSVSFTKKCTSYLTYKILKFIFSNYQLNAQFLYFSTICMLHYDPQHV